MKNDGKESMWNYLYVGLKNGWLSLSKFINIINKRHIELGCSEELVLEFNVCDFNTISILNLIDNSLSINESNGLYLWHKEKLIEVKESQSNISEKLSRIEKLWSQFDYPESWREFIYYLPNEKASSENELYDLFLEYLKR